MNKDFAEEISLKIRELVKNSPVDALEKNLNALLQGIFAKLDLVSREEFDIQTEILRQTKEKLVALEKQIEALDKRP
jgi:BMFP domain-containing protein YqiC